MDARALTPPAVALLLCAGSAQFWPDGPVLGQFGRILESFAPQMLLALVPLLGALALLGARRLAAVLALAGMLCAGGLVGRHLAVSAPLVPERPVDLRVLWFNVLADTTTPPAVLAQAVAESGADVAMLTEAAPLRGEFAGLARIYPYRLGCQERDCETVILSRLPFETEVIRDLGQPKPERLLSVQIDSPTGRPVTLLATHLAKPWFYGWIERDRWFLRDQLARSRGALIVAGDFNAAPWSQRMAGYFETDGLVPPRRPVATWPVWLGRFGVPIDHILLRGGAQMVSLAPWGDDLGSNHRGLIAGIALPPAPSAVTPPVSGP